METRNIYPSRDTLRSGSCLPGLCSASHQPPSRRSEWRRYKQYRAQVHWSVAANTLQQVAGIHEIYVPDPTWSNHHQIFGAAGLEIKSYPYLDASTGTTLDFGSMAAYLRDDARVPSGSAVLLHACAHNPTGIDPSTEQWEELSRIFVEREG